MSRHDLVSRLRGGVYGLNRIALCAEAADEIERLRKALLSIEAACNESPYRTIGAWDIPLGHLIDAGFIRWLGPWQEAEVPPSP